MGDLEIFLSRSGCFLIEGELFDDPSYWFRCKLVGDNRSMGGGYIVLCCYGVYGWLFKKNSLFFC